MRSRTLLSTLAVMLVGLMMSFAATTKEAMAQQNQNCCTYTVDCLVPASCLPFNVHTIWGNGFPPPANIVANGATTFPLPWACPPSSVFFGASINAPFGPFASYNNPLQYNANGCCLVIRITYDANGCPLIYVRPC